MIRSKKLPGNIKEKLPLLFKKLEASEWINSFYVFGSLTKGKLRPLSDLDFAALLKWGIPREKFFDVELELRGIIEDTLRTEEFDLIILNTAPPRFSFNILKTGELIFCKDRKQLIDFRERVIKYYLDFRYYRDQFDRFFLKKIDYHGRENI